MLLILQILVRTIVLCASAVALAACGQQGPLYLPPALSKTPTSVTSNSTVPRAPQPATATSAP